MQTEESRVILCPVDFSELSAHALRQSAILARCRQLPIVAVYANWFEAPPYFTEGRLEGLRKEFTESLSEAERMLCDFVAASLGGDAPAVQTRVVEALPVDAIRELVASTRAELVVMGTHGRSGFNHWTLGSVAERVLREVTVPVLTVRAAPRETIRHILCPVDDSEASRQALAMAVEWARCFDATVTALHVQEPHGGAPISNLCAWIDTDARTRCDIRELVRHGSADEEIVRLASEQAYDLLVIGAPRRRFFKGMMIGTTALRTVRHAPCPVLSVPSSSQPVQ